MIRNDCLVKYLSKQYSDAFVLAGIIFAGNIAEFLILYPLFPFIVASQKKSIQEISPFTWPQQNVVPEISDQLLESQDQQEERELQKLVESTRTETFFGLKFQSYLGLVAFVYAAFAVSILLLMFSLDDPRPIWRNHGWRQAVGAQELLVVGLLNGVAYVGSFLDTLIAEVLKNEQQYPGYLYPHWSFYALKVSQNGSLLSLLVVYIVYYPYIVTYLLSTCMLLVVILSVVCTFICWGVAGFCVFCWIFSIARILMEGKGAQDLGEDVVATRIAQGVTGLALYYLLQLTVIILTFLVSGGQTGRPICVHSQSHVDE